MPDIIAWEKWDDEIIEQESMLNYNLEGMEEEEIVEVMGLAERIPNLVITPMGMYRLHDKLSPSKQFNCWVGHTNFDITEEVILKIEEIGGVEAIKAITRYKFFLGIGKLFDFKEVRLEIEKEILGKHKKEEDSLDLDADVLFKIKKLRIELDKKNYWAIFIFPNGNIDCISSNDEDDIEYIDGLSTYIHAKKMSGGILLTK
mgnify:CR=1 FL=1